MLKYLFRRLLMMIPVMLYFSLSVITTDLLVLCLLVYYLAIIFSPDYPNKLSNAFLCGALGAAAYLGKSFIFLFFLAHFLVFNILHYYHKSNQDKKKKIFRNLIVGFLTFLLIFLSSFNLEFFFNILKL